MTGTELGNSWICLLVYLKESHINNVKSAAQRALYFPRYMFKASGEFCPEPLAHDAVDEKVYTGVEDNEDGVEVLNTIPEGRDGVVACRCAGCHSEILTGNTYYEESRVGTLLQ